MPKDKVVCVKPWVGMCGIAAERMDDSIGVKGPGGGGWSYEWYGRRRGRAMDFESGRSQGRMVLVAIVVIVDEMR